MSYDRKKIEALLKWYKQEVGKELKAVFILDREGKIIDFLTGSVVKAIEDFVEDIRDTMGLILNKIKDVFKLGTFGVGTFDTDEHRFIFCEAGPDHIIVTILDALNMADPVIPYVYIAAEKVARIFDGRPVSPVIPKMIIDESRKSAAESITRKVNILQKVQVPSSEYVYKLVLGGDGAVGKTSMVHRFVEGIFRTDYKATIGTAITKKECEFEGLSKVRFVIWDLAGQQQFERIRKNYLASSEAGILVYDITRRNTFENIKKWYDDFKKGGYSDILLLLVGNKTDLNSKRIISTAEGEKLAKELGISYIETSAMTGENINDAFRMIALQLIKRFFEAKEVSKIKADEIPKKIVVKDKKKKEAKEPIDLGDYKKIPITNIWNDKDKNFVPWLGKNIDYLNKVLESSLISIERAPKEIDVPVDILAEDKLGNKVLITIQYNKTDHIHLGKILSSLAYFDAKKVIWICEETSLEHEKIITWLNKNTPADVFFYLVKFEVFTIENSPPTLLFLKICGPLDKEKRMKALKTKLSYIERKRIEFWEKLIEKIYSDFPEHANMTPLKTAWIFQPAGKKGIRYAYAIKDNWGTIELYFDHTDRDLNKNRYKALEAKKEEINKEFEAISWSLSEELEWDFNKDRDHQSIRYRFTNGGLKEEKIWDELQSKMIDAMKCLVKSTQKYIATIID